MFLLSHIPLGLISSGSPVDKKQKYGLIIFEPRYFRESISQLEKRLVQFNKVSFALGVKI